MEQFGWNLWHGCHKLSEGCQNCYVYRRDAKYDKDPSVVEKTQNFNLPIKRTRSREYKIPSGSLIYTCFTSDFFVEDADLWRVDAWKMIRERCDCDFFFITKRIDRFYKSLPSDWGDGYDNVHIGCTAENQQRADYRLPIFLEAPIKHRHIVLEPLLEEIDLSQYLSHKTESVTVGGESGQSARLCDFDWVMKIRGQCIEHDVPFRFHQTGAVLRKDGKIYHIDRKFQHSQALRADINFGRTLF